MEPVIVAHTPLGDGQLLFKSLNGTEQLSALYAFEIELLSHDNNIALKTLLGGDLAVELKDQQAPSRYLTGKITQITHAGQAIGAERYTLYRATIRPAVWYLTQNRDFRIWQEKTVPEILHDLFKAHHILYENRLSWRYRQWDYCVQYQESDFDFISRLMEHEGIYYYFSHQADGQVLILADGPQAHNALAGHENIPWSTQEGHAAGISGWSATDTITPALYSMDDYDFRQPRARLLEVRQNPHSGAVGRAEVFDWPGRFNDRQQGEFYARIRQQELAAQHQQMAGSASACGIAPGYLFQLCGAPRREDERQYLTVSASWLLSVSPCNSGAAGGERLVSFTLVPGDINWRPLRQTRWPKTHGPQTAEVIGPYGETIWTDKYGRVKLKFRWDRHGCSDGSSSCWVRVSSSWAGWGYGALQVPRVGEEVVVDFINGDPDRPIITGRVYNQQNMPPWELPSAATRMGFMSRSSGGTIDNASFLFLDDALGNESFTLHAERDMTISVENDLHMRVGGNRQEHTAGDLMVSVDGSWQQEVNGGEIMISSPHKITLKSDTTIEMDAPVSTVNARSHAYTTTGFNVSINGLDIKMNAMSVGTTISSNEVKSLACTFTGLSLSKTGVTMQTNTIKYSGTQLMVDLSAVRTLMSGLFLYM
ncbi:type VI secretion system secreted protein VgrG [Erwinia toletana]|uniref:Type VI secretion system secreted protein VgrG n=3 Tax=Winslowiella toletana TaxID=92490 RepID=A0ABS4PCA5_9GAMM|nr:type VI secretion system tip protein TssI/VgrG [Winslowiella toletana]MBP2169750.1 type VI secretion system secreted protein VgrG [Winslowiella toletana]